MPSRSPVSPPAILMDPKRPTFQLSNSMNGRMVVEHDLPRNPPSVE